MSSPRSFGSWLRLKRKSLDLTREALADRVGCSAATIRKIEAEERRPSEQIARRLAEIFFIPVVEWERFLRFARGDLASAPGQDLDISPWQAHHLFPRTNLPADVTSLIGRDQEVAELCEYLQKGEIRIVTLVGPPGIGKTRLSLETARRSLQNFRDGVLLITLAPLSDPSLIASTIVETLGYSSTNGESPLQTLEKGISNQHMLLILDNCEHVIEEIALLASRLLAACPHLKIISTSRESFRIPGEWLYPVPALGLPSNSSSMDLETAMLSPAVRLFVERAGAVHPGFTLTENSLAAVSAICTQLDGLPLAIELIASRIRTMSPQALLEKINEPFVLYMDGMRAVSPRQKMLSNAIAWSYNSLSPHEQQVLACSSVFSNGFTLESAAAVLAGRVSRLSLADILTSLSDKSLLVRRIPEQGEIRYSVLYVIQQFALEQLRQAGNETQVRDAHLTYFVEHAEAGERAMRSSQQLKWIDRIESEHDNNRAALEWAVSTQRTESALRLLAALGWPWEVRGYYNEALGWLDKIRVLPDAKQYATIYVQILNHVGRYFWTQSKPQLALNILEESQAISLSLGEAVEPCLAATLNWLGLLLMDTSPNETEKVRTMLLRARELYQRCGDAWGIALTSFHLGILEGRLRNTEQARYLMEQSHEQFLAFGDTFFIGRTSLLLGNLYFDLGNLEKAGMLFEAHLKIDTELKFWYGIAEGWFNMGRLHRQKGDAIAAERDYGQCRTICREHGLSPLIS